MIRRLVAAMLVGATVTAGTAEAQTVRFLKFTPEVVVPGQTAPVLMEVETTGTVPSQVTLEPGGAITTTIVLRDDGAGGDRVAGDRTYTCQLNAAQIVAAMRADDVHRVFLGFLNLSTGSRSNIFVDVYGADAGTYPITRLSQFVQVTPRLVNIQDPTYFVSNDPAHVTQEFYRWFGDDFDVLNLIYSPERFQNRNHFTVKNTVDGIGLARTDNTARYGSAGRLQGISQFPIPGLYDGAENGHIHELGHQWINFLNFTPISVGIPHWPPSSMAGGVMGFSIGGTGGEGGDFRCNVTDQNGVVTLTPRTDAAAYNDFDLYLMGLLPADQVRQQVVFTNVTSPPACGGQVYTGSVQRVSVQDIINRYGPRLPAAGSAPTTFRLATVLVTRDELATQEMMWLYNWFAERAELQTRVAVHSGFLKELGQPFYLATGGRGTLDMRVAAVGQDDFRLVPTPSSASVTAGSAATYSISALPQLATFDSTVSFSCNGLPAHAACVFSPPQVVPGATGKDVALTITTKDASASAPVRPLIGLTLVAGAGWLRGRRTIRRRWALAAVVALAAAACGGSSTPPMSAPTPTPTPAPTTTAPGTYSITVVGTSGSLQRSALVTLTVQ
ncbi:MAG TPA: hypothetical protein VJN96_19785 [Vicinamibacterales bacterium]|nr:hypothetical protein [Vicinamibacterales bacterium]